MLRVNTHLSRDTFSNLGPLPQGLKSKVIEGVSLDTRSMKAGDVFFALKAKRDGQEFIPEAFKKGASFVVAEQCPDQGACMQVPNARDALGQLASCHRQKWQGELCAISGSNGKTTTKEFLGQILSQFASSLISHENWNNYLGVSLSLLTLKDQNKFAVLEMGMNALGEIKEMMALAEPTVVCLTNIGRAHIGKLGSQENIIQAKAELFKNASIHTALVVNLDDKNIRSLADQCPQKKHTFSSQNNLADIYLNLESARKGQILTIKYGSEKISVQNPFDSNINMQNALAAIACAYALKVPAEQVVSALSTVNLPRLRFQENCWRDRFKLSLDCYNANPDSMRAALAYLASKQGQRAAILAAMAELGAFSKEAHLEIGRYCAELKLDRLYVLESEFSEYIQTGALKAGMDPDKIFTSDELSQIKANLNAQKGSWSVLVKGSRTAKLENLFDGELS